MSKSLKRVIGVVAAIAIPFAAPAIAGAILGSAATAFATTATSAAVGAALGAGSAAVTGGDVGKAALFGGLGGGIGGFTAARAKAAADAASAASAAGTGGSGSIEAVNAGQSLSSMATPSGTTASQLGGMGTALGGAPVVAPTFAGGPLSTVGTQVAGLSATPAAAAGTAAAGTAAAGTTAGAPMTFTQALKSVPSQIAAKFSDPGKLADLTLRAGGQLAGSALSDSGLSPEEKGLLNAQTEELRNLQQTNRAAFDARMQQAMNLIGESRYFDPEYFGLQRARREQVAVGRQRQAGLRGLSGGRRQAEGRRYDIESGRRTGTAYDVGYGQGIAGRLQTRQAGISAMPTEFSPQAFGGYESLLSSYGVGANRQRQQQEDIGNLFGSFTGGYGAKKTGDEKEEEKA